jgi:protein-L-isoaspartate(D-aspartate) O-methyltransferase
VDKKALIQRLQKIGYLQSKPVVEAIRAIPREQFISKEQQVQTYTDIPLPIGHGQTISAPHMVAMMAEALQLEPNHTVLEIGTGTGYHAAVVSRIIYKAHIYSIERIPELALEARRNFKALEIDNVTVIIGDGSQGLPEYAPYDRIYATCATLSVPKALIEQLTPNGKLLLPLGQRMSRLILIEKNHGLHRTDLGGCAFVPMVSDGGHNAQY